VDFKGSLTERDLIFCDITTPLIMELFIIR
jgi:hypothetical protein